MYSPFVRRRPALGPTQRRSDGAGLPEAGEEEGLIEPTGPSGSGETRSPMLPVQPSTPAHSARAGIPPKVFIMIASVPRGSPERLTARRQSAAVYRGFATGRRRFLEREAGQPTLCWPILSMNPCEVPIVAS